MKKENKYLKYTELVELNKKVEQFLKQYIEELNTKIVNDQDIYFKVKNKIIEKMAIIAYNEAYQTKIFQKKFKKL